MLVRHLPVDDTGDPVILALGFGDVAVQLERSPQRPERNEDCLAVWQLGPHHVILAVADGMGGAPAGDAAARLVVESLDRALQDQHEAIDAAGAARAALMDGIERASVEIRNMGVGAASTVVLAEIQSSGGDTCTARCIYVGDSQMLHCGQRGVIRFRSTPHSPVGYAVEAGLLDEEAAMMHADRHLVSNMVGLPDMQIQVGPPMAIKRRDTLVLASDGLWDNLAMDQVVGLVRAGPLPQVARQLSETVERAMAGFDSVPGKPDDLSLLIFRRSD